jgi:DNA-binding GntR family transcriptional regulator
MEKKETLKLQAYNAIKAKIISCEYAPNTLLNEELLHDELNVSRTPIRDALGRLEQEGLLTILPKKGIMVSGTSINDVNMVFEVRMMYEPYALLHYGSRLPFDTLLRFHRAFSDLGTLSEGNAFYEEDDCFHNTIIQTTNNRYLCQSYEYISNQSHRFRVLTGRSSSQRLEQTSAEHLKILIACLKQDWSGAAAAMREHLIASKNVTFDLLMNQIGTPNE